MAKLGKRWPIWLQLLWIVPLGFHLKYYDGRGAWWINDYAAAVLYELFWIFLIYGCLLSRRALVWVPVGVFVATSALEVLQLSKAAPLTAIRSHFLGRSLIGTTFDPWDFPVYLLSCVLGWLLLLLLTQDPRT